MSVLLAVLLMAGLTLVFGLILGIAAVKFKVEGNPIVEEINAILPQQQCGKCGFPGCHPYAEAIANGSAEINLCPPGGESGMLAIAHLLDREPKPLSEEHHVEKPKAVAVIDEQTCIGCTLCIQACPVDAILGSAKHMHTIIASECTGCELCIAPCPVDCIRMSPIQPTTQTWKYPYPVFRFKVEELPQHRMETAL
ncbi:electron transport complex, RnfABCDGE type, B subunit [Beggiatoa alba B18LD]|uniref:Ion-translocating oxidoreductase complex subunit B n=1 Tax=Beggiatoa alba B18LD TaxID=395493 RepID=I3CGV3_9GAMM|nr:electron transport complex subunit RsxB [Beggiatoa alba]EIJ42846.1 electron transport complex, RnfABCDGE type, B subunit [Beggiatoa alba B18LD]